MFTGQAGADPSASAAAAYPRIPARRSPPEEPGMATRVVAAARELHGYRDRVSKHVQHLGSFDRRLCRLRLVRRRVRRLGRQYDAGLPIAACELGQSRGLVLD